MTPPLVFRRRLAAASVCLAIAGTSIVLAQTPFDRTDADLRAHFALQALDRYLETWNSRDGRIWAGSLNFPHVRPGPGAFEVSQTPEEYAAGVNFAQTLSTGWHHSEWTTRRVLQVGADKVHVAGSWTRYTADDQPLTGSAITYIVTHQQGRWGVLSRFAAGPTGLESTARVTNAAAAEAALAEYFAAWNSHEPNALANTLHYPHVRIGDGMVDVVASPAALVESLEAARQRTWYETRLDSSEVVQVAANGVNIAITYSRRTRTGDALSSYEAVALVVRREGTWKVQAISTMGN